MPITTGLTSRTATKGEGHIHSEKWHRCIEHVKENSPGYEPHAVCTNAIGYKDSINPEHRTPGPHASASTRRFKESAKRRREAQKMESYAAVLKFDEALVYKEHKCWGHDCGGGPTIVPSHLASQGVKEKIPPPQPHQSGAHMGLADQHKMIDLPRGKVSEAHQKELGLPPGKYRNRSGVGVMGMSHEDLKKEPARVATDNADTHSRNIALDKKKNASHLEHDQAARAHSVAANEHEKLGNTKEMAYHRAQAKFHREQSKRIKG